MMDITENIVTMCKGWKLRSNYIMPGGFFWGGGGKGGLVEPLLLNF